jgi:hypothetical protein
MKTPHIVNASTMATGLLLASLSAACAGERRDAPPAQDATKEVPAAQATEVTGCLRGGTTAGTHVLVTAPDPMSASVDRSTRGQVATYTYLLVGGDLEPHVGRQVSVTGTIEAADDMEVEKSREQQSAPTEVDGDTVTPTVEIEETAVIEMRRMRVERVQPTGEPCAIAE